MLASLIQLFPSPTGSVVPVLIYLAISGVYANASSCAKYAWQMLIYPAISGVFANASSCAKYAWQMPPFVSGARRDEAHQLLPRFFFWGSNYCHVFFLGSNYCHGASAYAAVSGYQKCFCQVPIDRSHGHLQPVTCDRSLFSICGNKSLGLFRSKTFHEKLQ
jgi:hypothetical protein